MLQIKNITKTYQSGELIQRALNGVSINFRDNEFVSILGPSGSGKTTLLNIIGGLDQYDDGDLIINGVSTKRYDDRDWDAYRNHSIGFIFQSYNLIPHQNILSNVEMALTISGIRKKERRKRALDALEKVGLKEHKNKKPNQLSGGQMQRVAIARALVNNPDILLADEPTGALDSETGIQVMELLKEVAKDKLVIMVTHNPELAEQYSTRIIKISDGQVLSDSNPLKNAVVNLPEDHSKSEEKRKTKVSMGRLTAFSLSLKNLMTKKGRTVLTAIAGSIGLIGIALILSISDGVNIYIETMQKEAMAAYPINITSTAVSSDFLSQMETMMPTVGSVSSPSVENTDGVRVDYSSTQLGDSLLNNAIKKNNLSAFKKYLDDHKEEINKYVNETGIVYSYNINFDLFTEDSSGRIINMNESPENSSSVMEGISSIYSKEAMDTVSSLFGASQTNIASEILPDKNTGLTSAAVKDNYELLYGHWPENYDEMILVLSTSGSLSTEQMYQFGLISAEEYNKIVSDIKNGVPLNEKSFSYSDICNKTYTLVPSFAFYKPTKNGYVYNRNYGLESGIPVKIAGIVRLKNNANTMPILTPIGYTSLLSDYIINLTNDSDIAKKQLNDSTRNVLTGKLFDVTDNEKISAAKKFNQLSKEEKQLLLTSLMMSGHISIDINNIDYSNFYEMPEIDMNEILNSMQPDLSEEEKIQKFDEFVNGLTEEQLAVFMGSASEKTQLSDDQKLSIINAYLENISDEELLYLMEQSGKMGPLSNIISDEVKIKIARLYIKNLSDEEKLALFPKEEMSPMEMLDANTVKAILKSLSNEQKLQIYPMIQFFNGDSFDASSLMSSIEMPEISNNPEDMMLMYFDSWLNTASDSDLIAAYDAYASNENYESVLNTLGIVDKSNPSGISIYVDSFEDKDAIQAMITDYNEHATEDEKIEYTDFISLLTSSLTGIINAISYVLIAFVAVSLFVSSIMISVITSISVMERTKEIGVLRSLGASKKNVVSIFKAETCIIGLLSGFIGIVVSYLTLIPINILADKLINIDALRAVLKPEYAIALIVISVFITIIGGWIPARKAAKCDPVIALRSE